jgi:RNA polymerase sigma-70 factor, ECF subfamily
MSDDAEVIRQVLGGDREAFRALVERYQQPLAVMVRNMLGDAHEAADVAQDVFLAAYVNLASFDVSRSGFGTWLLTLGRNRCLNVLKKKRPVPLDNLPERGWTRGPEETLAEREVFARLDGALAALPVEQRNAFVLAELVGLPQGEIAEIEGVEASTVRSRLSRAKATLRAALDEFKEARA